MSAQSGYRTIEIEKQGPVDWLTLNRPERLNAIDRQMVAELGAYFDGLFSDRHTRVVVMRGAGRAFCAGLDIKARHDAGDDDRARTAFGGGFGFQGELADVYLKMRRCPQPIVALIQGAACGGGFAFALA